MQFELSSVGTENLISHGWILASSVIVYNNLSKLGHIETPQDFDPVHWVHGFLYNPVPSAIMYPDGRFHYVNEAFAILTGFSRSELEHKSFQSLTHPEDVDGTSEMIKRLIHGEQSHYSMQKRYITKFGDVIRIHLYVQAVVKQDDPEKVDYFYIHILPIELKEVMTTSEHGGSVAWVWIREQIKSKWLTIVLIIASIIGACIAGWVEYNRMKWQVEYLQKAVEQLNDGTKDSKAQPPKTFKRLIPESELDDTN